MIEVDVVCMGDGDNAVHKFILYKNQKGIYVCIFFPMRMCMYLQEEKKLWLLYLDNVSIL